MNLHVAGSTSQPTRTSSTVRSCELVHRIREPRERWQHGWQDPIKLERNLIENNRGHSLLRTQVCTVHGTCIIDTQSSNGHKSCFCYFSSLHSCKLNPKRSAQDRRGARQLATLCETSVSLTGSGSSAVVLGCVSNARRSSSMASGPLCLPRMHRMMGSPHPSPLLYPRLWG